MESVYKEGLHLYDLPQHLQTHLCLVRHQHSELNILEIGGGTGSFTAEVLKVLAPESDATRRSIAQYTFTDISSGFFEKAKQRFQTWSDIMTFQSLNIERNPIEQGFQSGKYDLIFAGNVIHATANLHTALSNLRSLLRPGGQLIMQEGIRQDFLWYPLVFGQLPGWWLGNEPIREWCPYIPATEWNKILSESGFSGVDIEYPSSTQGDLSWQSILVSTATDTKMKPPQNIFVLSSGSTTTADAIGVLRQMFPQIQGGPNLVMVNPSELDQVASQDSLFISLIDLEKHFLSESDETQYTALRKMLMECQNMLWVTPDPRDEPFTNMSMGLLRTVRWERDADCSNIVTLAIAKYKEVSPSDLAMTIHKIIERQFMGQDNNDRHAEYLLEDNMVHIGRLCEWEKADNFLAMQASNMAPELKRLGDLDEPLELVSGPTDPHWIMDNSHKTPLGSTEIEVEVSAVGLNSEPGVANLSDEASGVVRKTGIAVESLAPGDRVVFLCTDSSCFRTLVRVDQAQAVRLPEKVPLEVAAGLTWIYATALYGLGDVARLSADDTVLIHAAASVLGQAAIQYAKMIGAEIYATVSTPEDRAFITSEYRILDDHIFSSGDLSFARGIMRSTKGAGVDVIFNTLAGEALQKSLSCIAPFGRFIEASNKSARDNVSIDLAPLQRNMSISSIDMRLLIKQRPKIVRRLLVETLKLFSEDKIGQVRPMTVMDYTQIKEGIQALRENQRPGKIVFVPDPSNLIPIVLEVVPPYQFDSTASYLLAGGLGGLGRSLARWMAARGAKNLIFLSRSGQVTEPVGEMITDLKRNGCNAHIFSCDVADADRLRTVVTECSTSLPPIKGCIQGSMVLRVSLLSL
jgi:NADPH:quinone reductase-like Zn-dependent oxidoreductase/SAM-dependent methyltransferase